MTELVVDLTGVELSTTASSLLMMSSHFTMYVSGLPWNSFHPEGLNSLRPYHKGHKPRTMSGKGYQVVYFSVRHPENQEPSQYSYPK